MFSKLVELNSPSFQKKMQKAQLYCFTALYSAPEHLQLKYSINKELELLAGNNRYLNK